MNQPVVVIISADVEWQTVLEYFPLANPQPSPLGDWFTARPTSNGWEMHLSTEPGIIPSALADVADVIFFHGGWGKISAAAATQYVIDRWQPTVLFNLGTCGGFEGLVEPGTIILVERTIVYDIIEQMGDYDAHIAHYTTDIDLSWLERDYPLPVLRTLLVSGDRDLLSEEIPLLHQRYRAAAGDWESGAIAYVAGRNQTRLLILRGISDLVGPSGGEAYGNIAHFAHATQEIMHRLIDSLPSWIDLVFRR